MPKFVNKSKTTPMSVNYEGNTYIVPPGKTLSFDEPEEPKQKDSPIPDSQVTSGEVEDAPKSEEKTTPPKKGRGRKKEATK